ncbi:MAG: hypothetical protein IKC24_08910 [Oscillospiraceae bacterium]|nr:hypothetical protein [Oscillospiraceae bacterium]
MLKVGAHYTKSELTEIFGSKDRQALERKMIGYGIKFSVSGRGESLVYEIENINNPFKVFAITELDCGGTTDFEKLRNFYWYYFNDETFMAMPDEVKEVWLKKENKGVSRQTIAAYTQKLMAKDMINRNSKNFIYYFAFKDTQRLTTYKEYLDAWHNYWDDIANGYCSFEAICNMRANYGGVARKQAIPEINGIYNEKIEEMLSYIQKSIENEMEG